MREILYILQAAQRLPKIRFAIVGIREISKKYFEEYLRRSNLTNVEFRDFQPLENFYRYVRAADVLISYYDSFDPLSPRQRVPAKAGIYLASGKPVVFADLPGLREWWDDSMVYFVPPDRPDLLAEKINYVIEHPEEAQLKAQRCLQFARENTYAKAYAEVSRFIRSFSNN
jgi:glycosyltransferase involved in cell wall biosynthesis